MKQHSNDNLPTEIPRGLDELKAGPFSSSALSTAVSAACYGRDARYAVAQDARKGDSGLATTRNPGYVGLRLFRHHGTHAGIIGDARV
jgi:hypothetical protein